MKKFIIFLGLVLLVNFANAQSYAVKTISSDQVVFFLFGDTLIKDATFNSTYYVPSFVEHARLTLQIDTMASATDKGKVRAILGRSVNNVDYYSVAGDTITASATLASGHKIATSNLWSDIYENYLKVTVKAVDSTQNTKVRYYLLIDKNE